MVYENLCSLGSLRGIYGDDQDPLRLLCWSFPLSLSPIFLFGFLFLPLFWFDGIFFLIKMTSSPLWCQRKGLGKAPYKLKLLRKMGISRPEKAEIVMNLAGVSVPCSSCSGILDICSLSIMLSLSDLVL